MELNLLFRLIALSICCISAPSLDYTFKILIRVNESTYFINDIDGLSTNNSFIYLLEVYDEPYQLVKLNTNTMKSISNCVLPLHYNDTHFTEMFFILPFNDELLFIGYTIDLGTSNSAYILWGIDLTSMILTRFKQTFSYKQWSNYAFFQAIPTQNKIIINLSQ
ncbi:unnamed protein product, partial [Didymodactylos carnosus]